MNTKTPGSSSSPPYLLSLKTVIRTRDFDASKKFYTQLLHLKIIEEYHGENRGCIVGFGEGHSNAFLEISEITKDHYYFDPSFSQDIENDKIDIQIKTDSVDAWAAYLKEKWETRGPVDRPWGSRYLYLRDPDGLLIIIYDEQKSYQLNIVMLYKQQALFYRVFVYLFIEVFIFSFYRFSFKF